MIACKFCCYYKSGKDTIGLCYRYPKQVEAHKESWCGEFIKGYNRQDVSLHQDKKNQDDKDKGRS